MRPPQAPPKEGDVVYRDVMKGVNERTDEGVCPYIAVLYSTEQITCLLVNLSTRQLYLIIILNFEL